MTQQPPRDIKQILIDRIIGIEDEQVLTALLEQIPGDDEKKVYPSLTQEQIAWHRAAVLRGEEDFAAGRYYTHEDVKAWIKERIEED